MKRLKELPKDEILWVTYRGRDGTEEYKTTSTQMRDRYYLYKVVDSGFEKLGSAASPKELEKIQNMDKAAKTSC